MYISHMENDEISFSWLIKQRIIKCKHFKYIFIVPYLSIFGGCATVLVVWSLIILKYYSGVTSNGSSLGS